MLSGAGSGETYAADALNRDLISQLLGPPTSATSSGSSGPLPEVVAEAQEHYDYEERGGKRYPIMEEILRGRRGDRRGADRGAAQVAGSRT
jgi:hypothetical protein